MKKKLIDAEAWLAQCNQSWMYYNTAKKVIREAPCYEVEEELLTGSYADARLLVLPGTVIWDKRGEEWEVQRVELGIGGDWLLRCGRKGTEDYCAFYQEDVGDEWFLTVEASDLHGRVLPSECGSVQREPEKEVKPSAKGCWCRACGAEIVFVTMKSGAKMPCDAELIHAVADDKAKTSFVLPGGIIKRGREGRHPDGTADFVGYRSHFETCPKAGEFRRGRK